MPDEAEDPWGSLAAQVARRWQDLDPLLPEPPARPAGCGVELAASGVGGEPAALGVCEHWVGTPGDADLSWGTKHRFLLAPQIAGESAESGLDGLLSRWRDHLDGLPDAGDEDSAAIVNWPCRDIGGVSALLRHGFAPFGVVAARTAGRDRGPRDGVGPRDGAVPSDGVESWDGGESRGGAGARDGVDSRDSAGPSDGAGARDGGELRDGGGARRDGDTGASESRGERGGLGIRRAGPGDIDEVVRLGLEVVRFDAHFGGIERPESATTLRQEAARMLAGPEPWTWLAERDGRAVGLLAAQRPEVAGWIAPLVRAAPVAYLMLMFVLPGERGTGVAAELVARLHHDVDAAGVAVTLLHYEQTNPLSAPFWSRQGYRPLWTSWEVRPARAIR